MTKEEGNSPLSQRISVWTLDLAQAFVESGLDLEGALAKAKQVSLKLGQSFPELHKQALTSPSQPFSERKKPGPKPGFKALRAQEALRAQKIARDQEALRVEEDQRIRALLQTQEDLRNTENQRKEALRTKVSNPRAEQGRSQVEKGIRPPIKDAITEVLGDRILSGDDIYAGLEKRKWLPNSKEPRKYVGYLLSSTKDRFEAVKSAGRGIYRAVGVVTSSNPQQEDDIIADLGGMFDPVVDKSNALLGRIAPLLDKPRRTDWLARKLEKPLPEMHTTLKGMEEAGSVVRVKGHGRTVWALSPKAKSGLSSL